MATTILRRALSAAACAFSCRTAESAARGVGVSRHLKELYQEESWEVGVRLARAAKAEEDGHPEVASLMEDIARDEARHLSLVVRLLHPEEVERDVRTNLEAMIDGDRAAAAREQRLAATARQAGMEREASLFEALARDEEEHVVRLDAALQSLTGRGSNQVIRAGMGGTVPPRLSAALHEPKSDESRCDVQEARDEKA